MGERFELKGNKAKWRLIIDQQPLSAPVNMAIDEAMLIAHRQFHTLPTLRLYQWQKPTLSVGYFQNIDKDVDLSSLKRNQIDLIKRPTGGRAVLHNQELTYSIVIEEDYPAMPRGVTNSYRYLSQGLVKALEFINIFCELAAIPSGISDSSNHSDSNESSQNTKSPACYDAPSWYEILVQGKKIIGSAQIRKQGAILQHGSIPLELDVDLLFNILKFSNETVRERMKQKFLSKAISVNQAGSKQYSIHEIQVAVINGFAEALSLEFQLDSLSKEELSIAEALVSTKYGTDQWK